jgi:heme exporter protein B
VLWVAALLSSLLAADSLLKSDAQDGTLEQYVLSGQPLTWLLLAKTAAHWMLSGVPLVLMSPLVALALGAPTSALDTVIASLLMGTLTLSLLGAIGAALTIGLRRGSLLLALLVLPLAMPLLIFGARAVELAIAGEPVAGPMYLLGALLVLTLTLAPLTTAAAVRISID